MSIPHFYYHPMTLRYEFGPMHPLRPERLRRTIQFVRDYLKVTIIEPELATRSEILLAHSPRYVDAVESFSRAPADRDGAEFNFGRGDNPIFAGMFEASLAYCGGAVAAAKAVSEGARRAYSIAGGLHHARHAQAMGFCIFNDPVIALKILRQKFSRVAYVDIDVHHGEGVQFAFDHDSTVLTCSIHQDGRTLFPGTGGVLDVGPSGAAINVPLPPETSGDIWLEAFKSGILPAVRQFNPEALVIQCGTDAHFSDPLARVQCLAQDWLGAIDALHDLNLPTVILGGGGYHIGTVPRLWVGAICRFANLMLPERIPEPFASEWGEFDWLDKPNVTVRGRHDEKVKTVIDQIRNLILPNVPTSAA